VDSNRNRYQQQLESKQRMSVIHVERGTPESFRNTLYNIDLEGNRAKIYPHKPAGRYTTARRAVSVVLLAFFFAAPFVKVNGLQFLQFNIPERTFILFGIVFFPQDFYIVVLGALTLIVSVVLFSSVFGRIWCGWMCPQTVFLEMVFRRIEFAIEGSGIKQQLFEAAPFTVNKAVRKALKHGVFFLIAVIIANTFLAYIIGSDAVLALVQESPLKHPVGFGSLILFSVVFYAVFARFREQACIVVCPYGRLQSVFVDRDTVLVTYDSKRGEPRGKFTKEDKQAVLSGGSIPASRGDCIDCGRCRHVCPTGIDIRNGIQMECVNCTACMDACDEIMTKISKPKGLIRYTSQSSVETGSRYRVTNRVKAYVAVWLLLMMSFGYLFARRPMTDILILRQPGTLMQTTAGGDKINFYVMNIVNKNTAVLPLNITCESHPEAKLTVLGNIADVPGVSERSVRFILALPPGDVRHGDLPVTFVITSGGVELHRVTTAFVTTGL
jgi:cytochrome c oxidase accessory protein FixG